MNHLDDANLVAASRNADRDAYSALVRRYTRRVFAICMGILGDPGDSEDITQETFLKGFSSLGSLREEARFAAWIARIARNLCLDLIRKRNLQKEQQTENNFEIAAASDDFTDLNDALSKLPEKHRVPLMLFYFNGHSSASVAEMLDISRAGACTRLSRARKELKRILTGEEK